MSGAISRIQTRKKIADVKRLKDAGVKQKEIAKKTGVKPRTQRDWGKRGLLDDSATWPDDQMWPGWNIDELEAKKLDGFNHAIWEGNLGMIQTSEAKGNRYIGWFFKRLVDWGSDNPLPDEAFDWSIAIAGLPVIGHWLDCPSGEELAKLIEAHRPWEGRLLARQRRRAAYSQAARSVATSIRQCILETQAQLVLKDLGDEKVTLGPVLLAALADRVPLFDRVKRTSPYRKYNTAGIVLGILALPKGEI